VLKPVAYWDTSALVTLCVDQADSARALLFADAYGIVVWWATPIEIASASAQLLRQEKITSAEYAHVKLQAEQLANTWHTVAPSASIAKRACGLLETHPLRAADALQLAAALEWCEGKPDGEVFLTFDRRLSQAAGLVGFALK